MVKKKIKNRSDSYQHLLVETSFPHEMLEAFPEDDSIYRRLNPFAYNDEIAELEDELKREFWRIIEEELTDRQKQLLKLAAEGKTQIEIAKIMGVNQSSVTKALFGSDKHLHKIQCKTNKSSSKSSSQVTYGGIKKKLSRAIEKDEKVKEILLKIRNLRENEWL